MAGDLTITRIGAAGLGPASPGGVGGADAQLFAQAVQGAAGAAPGAATPALAAPASKPVQEVQRLGPPRGEGALGQTILDRIEQVHRGDVKLKRNAAAAPAAPFNPAAAASALPAGPASAPLPAAPTASAPAPGDSFNANMRLLEQVYGQAIQVGMVTKASSSFTSSLNKLMSAN